MPLTMSKPMITTQSDAESADSASGIAAPGTYRHRNSAIHTAVANMAAPRVSRPFATLDARRKDAVRKNMDTGGSTKKATEA